MGNSNPCEAVGWYGKEIGTKDVEDLWAKYDADKSGRLDQQETLKFLCDFGKALGAPISKEAAKQLYDDHNTDGSGISKRQFFTLFLDASAGDMSLTESLAAHMTEAPPISETAEMLPISETAEMPPISETAEMPPISETVATPVLERIRVSEVAAMPIIEDQKPRRVVCKK